jgi:ABC-type Fe3+-hydroxamate transport system substrate-binding protein
LQAQPNSQTQLTFFLSIPMPAYFRCMILQENQPLPFVPKRIVSLVPSITELLHYLSLEEETIGITKFCIHPNKWFRSKARVGGTKTINITALKNLQPDLIIANKEENVKEQVEELATDLNVLVTDVNNITDALQMILQIGKFTNKTAPAIELANAIEKAFLQITPHSKPIKTAYLIWNNPYMSVGGDTFINDMLQHCGLQNIFAEKKRYPIINIDQLKNSHCELVLLSTEPYPFKQKHIDVLQQQLPSVKIILVDGEMFSWYGSRMLLAAAYLVGMRNMLFHN